MSDLPPSMVAVPVKKLEAMQARIAALEAVAEAARVATSTPIDGTFIAAMSELYSKVRTLDSLTPSTPDTGGER